MAPVALRFVVRFSSEDAAHKAENLLKSGSWKCAKGENSGRIEAELQFEKTSKISHIDIGNDGSAFIEILVGSSMWAHDKEYQTLLPSTMLMKPAECKSWSQTRTVRMFNEASFLKGALGQQWDRIRIICRQPFRKDKQFGLLFIRIASKEEEGSPTSTSDRICIQQQGDNEESRQDGIMRLKRTSGLLDGPRNGKASPKEFLNRGAKMLHAALDSKTTPTSPATNSQMPKQRLTPHKGKSRKDLSSPPGPKWSLTANFCDEMECFLEGIDFSHLDLKNVTFADLRQQMETQRNCQLTREERKVFLKIVKKWAEEAAEETEEAEEAHTVPSKRHSIPPHLTMNNSRAQSSSTKDSKDTSWDCAPDSSERRTSKKLTITLEDDPCDLPPMCSSSPSKKSKLCIDETTASVQCPLCTLLFPCDKIESHAALCMLEPTTSRTAETAAYTQPGMPCPICLKSFPLEEINAHADACAESAYEDTKVDVAAGTVEPAQENNVITT